MPNRIIREGLISSKKVTSMSEAAQLFYVLLLLKADDFGCFDAHPTLLRAACYPYRIDEKTDDQVRGYLDECSNAGLVQVYAGDGKECLFIFNYKQQTRQTKRRYPEPPPLSTASNKSNGNHVAKQVATQPDKQTGKQLRSEPCTIRTPLSYAEGLVEDVVGDGGVGEAARQIDGSEGFSEYEKKFPGLDVAKEYSRARIKLGREPPRKYFEKWLKNEQSEIINGAPKREKTKNNEWEPPAKQKVIEWAQNHKLAASFGLYCWNLWNGNGWKNYGDPIRDDKQWQSLMKTIKWEGH